MKYSIVLCAALLSPLAVASNTCMGTVHKYTMAPVDQMESLGTDANGITTVVRTLDTRYAPMGVELSKGAVTTTTFQCNGKGQYRQFITELPVGWSPWRDGSEWNADHWITF